jgi:general secretion pathway protein M
MTALISNRTPREKMLLAVLVAILTLWLAVTLGLAPLLAARRDMAARIPRIERALEMVHQAPVPEEAADPRPLAALVTDGAATLGLSISRLQPQGNKVDLTLEDAAFETVLLWIEAMERDGGLRLSDLALTRRAAPGIVGAALTVER